MSNLSETRPDLYQAQQEPYDRPVGSAQENLHLATSITTMVEQHERKLIKQAEAEARGRTLAVVGEESKLFRRQVRERLLAAESEVQGRIEAALAHIREHMFEQIREEMDTILSVLEGRLRDSLGEAPPLEVELGPWVQCKQEGDMRQPAARGVQAELEAASPAEDLEGSCSEVSLQIEPPLSLLSLIQLYRRLWRVQEVSVLQALGSADKGATLVLRLTQPAALQKILDWVSCVKNVQDTSFEAAGNGRPVIHVVLKSPDAEMIGNHEQV